MDRILELLTYCLIMSRVSNPINSQKLLRVSAVYYYHSILNKPISMDLLMGINLLYNSYVNSEFVNWLVKCQNWTGIWKIWVCYVSKNLNFMILPSLSNYLPNSTHLNLINFQNVQLLKLIFCCWTNLNLIKFLTYPFGGMKYLSGNSLIMILIPDIQSSP